MSHLIALRQRLKAVGTIKKITSAMRLIACSVTGQLGNRAKALHEYQHALKELVSVISANHIPNNRASLVSARVSDEKVLYICVGAQKGLCGSFNNQLAYWFVKNKLLFTSSTVSFMAVGKMTADFIKKKGYVIDQSFDMITVQSLQLVANDIAHAIRHNHHAYHKVILVGAKSKNFFTHELIESQIYPLDLHQEKNASNKEVVIFEQNKEVLYEDLLARYTLNCIASHLLQSLLAEQNARFIAMDNATRNANKSLDMMKRQYNKLRQAKITKELTELTAHFQK